MRIACWQATCAPGGVPAFLEALESVARRAADGGAALLVTPEMSVGGYPLSAAALAEAREPATGRHSAAVARIARESGVAIVHGWPEAAGPVVHNTAAVTSPTGRLLAYRKSHLYGPQERALFAPGSDGVVQARFGGFTVGLLICYDVEFPEAVRAHALAGTDLLVVPTALMRPWDFVARVVVPARAFENGLFLVYTNWSGDRDGLGFCGLTRVVGPDGAVLAAAGDGEELLFADIDPARVLAARSRTTYLQDRRPELYEPAP
ncbi:carbon-nitrogen hydrolase family protein [Streptomyces sp. NPDC059169]|uniref:carbon-nitrogen hydrolase family protein n=1 Tax=Streptomyces sp. NPDC059169 TaxID=3346754 RepID=UPI0036B69BE5